MVEKSKDTARGRKDYPEVPEIEPRVTRDLGGGKGAAERWSWGSVWPEIEEEEADQD